jgi:hypothetical protein
MAQNGGKREGAGRKSKAEEQQLIEKLSPLEPKALKQLELNVNKGERWAIELFFKYNYGMPKQQTDITTNGNDINISPIEWVE